jgi:hypothetical protein
MTLFIRVYGRGSVEQTSVWFKRMIGVSIPICVSCPQAQYFFLKFKMQFSIESNILLPLINVLKVNLHINLGLVLSVQMALFDVFVSGLGFSLILFTSSAGETRLKILPVLTREHYTSLLH